MEGQDVHIQDGILPVETLIAGGALSTVGVAVGLKRLDPERLPQAAVVCSAFFVASLIRVPAGGTSAHLVLNGLAGLMLGWAAFPALLVALFLQAVLFGHGGLTTLGVNTLNMALPAVVCWYAFGRSRLLRRPATAGALGFAAGFGGVALGCVMWAATLSTAGEGFGTIAAVLFVAHGLVMLVEGFVTSAAVTFLVKVRPEALAGPAPSVAAKELSHA